jgi:hypothetical protein
LLCVEDLRDAFSRAAKAHSRDATLHQWLASVWRSRGDQERAAAESRIAKTERERAERLRQAGAQRV